MPEYTVAQVCTSVSWQEKLSALLSRFIFLVNTRIIINLNMMRNSTYNEPACF